MQRAYSYIRFSKRHQGAGDSYRRQLALTQAYCDRNGLPLDTQLSLQDLGVSAFEGKNAKDGALSVFLDAVQLGRVPRGSVLIVESLDRLSRESATDALDLFKRLLEAGIEIVTLQPERRLTRASLNDFGSLMELLVIAFRANEESATKSSRCREAWEKKRKEMPSKPASECCPAWLRLQADRKRYEVKPKAAKAVRRIFQLASEGHGAVGIARKLTEEKVAPFGGKKPFWCKAYITKILNNRAVFGEHQPHVIRNGKAIPEGEPIPHYYPVVIKEAEFHATRRAVELRRSQRGPWGKRVRNLFTGIIYDARDGCRMHVRTKGHGRRNPSLVSEGAVNGREGSEYLGFSYEAIERLLLMFLDHDLAAELIQTKGTNLDRQITDLTRKLTNIKSRKQKIVRRASEEQDFDALLDIAKQLEADEKATAKALEQLQQQQGSNHAAALGEARGVLELLRTCPAEELTGLRLRLKARVRSLVREIWVLIQGPRGKRWATLQIFLHSGNTLLIHDFSPGILQAATAITRPEDGLSPKDDLRQWRKLKEKPTFGPPRKGVLTTRAQKAIQEILESYKSAKVSGSATQAGRPSPG